MSKEKLDGKGASRVEEGLPEPPPGWDRCHAYLPQKKRFCRQCPTVINTDGTPNYCGNHTLTGRIPCPLDPSHHIDANEVDKHLLICPVATNAKQQSEQSHFIFNLNAGGFGVLEEGASLGPRPSASRFAECILRLHQKIFAGVDVDDVSNITLDDIQSALPMEDLSDQEGGIHQAVADYHIRSGGPKHIRQQASLVGHLRRLPEAPILVEVGAGRGMTGLIAAGVQRRNHLVLLERSGCRSKADTVLRKAKNLHKEDQTYMDLTSVQWSRVQCDLAHAHMPTILKDNQQSVTILAKHLCGVGTDFALKSLEPLKGRVASCIFATCCHGVCNWSDYVGRSFLRRAMVDTGGLACFGSEEFELMRQWSAGTVQHLPDDEGHGTEREPKKLRIEATEADRQVPGHAIGHVVSSLKLKCGVPGLGRVCQRLIDYGRSRYLQDEILGNDAGQVRLLHYVSPETTPQNAMIVGSKRPAPPPTKM